ncbi:transcription factor Adf-1-like isoform X2 [Spodoptera litura]|nr:transcription factor Adf-1-like isoform X2 [Spodoptera litura]
MFKTPSVKMQRKLVLSDQSLKKLIKEVKKRECLWNPHHERYNDRYRMAKAWMEVAELMELPEDRLRVRWKNLRDLFKKEIKKFGSVNYTGKWRHYNAMKFLNKVTESSKPDQTEDTEQTEDQTNKDNEEENEGNKVATKEELTDDDFDFVDDQENVTAGSHEAEVYFEQGYEEDPIPDKMQKLPEEDYDMMFLKSLAPYFRQLDPIRKLVVRSKMQDMLLNEIAAQSSVSQQFHSKKS